MEYRARNQFELITWLLLNGLMWVGIIGIAWNLLRPGGWLLWISDLVAQSLPASLYYLGAGVLVLLAGKFWLDYLDPQAASNLLTAACAFAGTFFILGLLLPL